MHARCVVHDESIAAQFQPVRGEYVSDGQHVCAHVRCTENRTYINQIKACMFAGRSDLLITYTHIRRYVACLYVCEAGV